MNDEHARLPEPGTLVFRRVLPGPVERVWAFLVEPEKRRLWLAGGEMEPRLGGKVALHFRHAELSPVDEVTPDRYAGTGNGASFTGTVTRWEPPHALAYTWAESWGEDSEVTFELTAQGEQVVLLLTHRRLGEQREALLSVAAGWHTHLGILVERLNDRVPPGFWRVHERMENEYAAILDKAHA